MATPNQPALYPSPPSAAAPAQQPIKGPATPNTPPPTVLQGIASTISHAVGLDYATALQQEQATAMQRTKEQAIVKND